MGHKSSSRKSSNYDTKNQQTSDQRASKHEHRSVRNDLPSFKHQNDHRLVTSSDRKSEHRSKSDLRSGTLDHRGKSDKSGDGSRKERGGGHHQRHKNGLVPKQKSRFQVVKLLIIFSLISIERGFIVE